MLIFEQKYDRHLGLPLFSIKRELLYESIAFFITRGLIPNNNWIIVLMDLFPLFVIVSLMLFTYQKHCWGFTSLRKKKVLISLGGLFVTSFKNGTLTFLNPTNASLSNNISWKDANQVIGSKKNSGAAEFHFTVANGNQINVAPQARVQYGLYTANTIIPLKIWSNYAYVNHTLN